LFFATKTPKKMLFSERELKKHRVIARQIAVSRVVWTLIDNDKLANQIARLAAIVVKK